MAKRKLRRKKASAKKKSGRRPAKKKGRRKVVPKKSTRRISKKKPSKPIQKTVELPVEPIGRVTHYFPQVRATAIMIEKDGIQVGDTLYFKGHTTQFKQKVDSLQINHKSVPQGSAGEEVGIRVKLRTREHDLVFKL